MRAIKRLDGSSSFHILDFKLSATVIEGQAVIASATGTDGGSLKDATTTSLVDMVGVVLGASSINPHGGGAGSLTYSSTQGDTEGLVRVVINPDAIFEALMSGGATEGTALETFTNASENTAGTTITDASTGDNSMDDGISWGLSGANAGLSRKITTYSADTSFVVTVPYPRTIAVGDTFACAPYLPLTTTTLQLTTLLTQADASIAVGTGGNARVVELILNGVSDSKVHFIARDHVFNELS